MLAPLFQVWSMHHLPPATRVHTHLMAPIGISALKILTRQKGLQMVFLQPQQISHPFISPHSGIWRRKRQKGNQQLLPKSGGCRFLAPDTLTPCVSLEHNYLTPYMEHSSHPEPLLCHQSREPSSASEAERWPSGTSAASQRLTQNQIQSSDSRILALFLICLVSF